MKSDKSDDLWFWLVIAALLISLANSACGAESIWGVCRPSIWSVCTVQRQTDAELAKIDEEWVSEYGWQLCEGSCHMVCTTHGGGLKWVEISRTKRAKQTPAVPPSPQTDLQAPAANAMPAPTEGGGWSLPRRGG